MHTCTTHPGHKFRSAHGFGTFLDVSSSRSSPERSSSLAGSRPSSSSSVMARQLRFWPGCQGSAYGFSQNGYRLNSVHKMCWSESKKTETSPFVQNNDANSLKSFLGNAFEISRKMFKIGGCHREQARFGRSRTGFVPGRATNRKSSSSGDLSEAASSDP